MDKSSNISHRHPFNLATTNFLWCIAHHSYLSLAGHMINSRFSCCDCRTTVTFWESTYKDTCLSVRSLLHTRLQWQQSTTLVNIRIYFFVDPLGNLINFPQLSQLNWRGIRGCEVCCLFVAQGARWRWLKQKKRPASAVGRSEALTKRKWG